MNRLVIVGAGGHGKAIADNALKNGYTDINFVDDTETGTCLGFPIIGVCSDVEKFNDGATDFIIGIGNNAIRRSIAEKYDVNWITLCHPSAQIAVHVSIGRGTVIMAGAVVNVCAQIGEHCIVNSNVIVEHDNKIADYVHLSPGAKLGGMVSIGQETHVGIGATVTNNTDICAGCVIGAGAVVVKALASYGTYVGVPARKLR